jgi:hypothetical protein
MLLPKPHFQQRTDLSEDAVKLAREVALDGEIGAVDIPADRPEDA